MESFITKYSNTLDIHRNQLESLFTFRPVLIDHPTTINEGIFRFFYTYHSIPCIGFTVQVGEKSVYFSADTFYDPEALFELKEQGIMNEFRFNQLTKNIFDHTIIVHEAGIPPIHTPLKILNNLSQEIKDKLYCVHVSDDDIAKFPELKKNKCGVEHTIILE